MANSNQQIAQVAQGAAVATQDKGAVTYTVAGQEVKLSYQIVRNFLVRGNGQVSDQDLVQFISICKFNQLNPFLNEAYLVKFGSTPAQMIVSKEALLKRADACPDYEGIQAGIIVRRADGTIADVEGAFYDESETLVGGWAKVYRKDRKFPIVSRVRLDEYDKKQSVWNEKRSTMITKIAKVQALREAFPAQLGAMYTSEEQGVDNQYMDVREEIKRGNASRQVINIPESATAPAEPVAVPVENVNVETGEILESSEPTFDAPGF